MRIGNAIAGELKVRSASIRIICSAVLLVTVLGVARAQPPGSGHLPEPAAPDRWANHSFGAEIDLGVGTPIGLIGAVFDWTPLPWWSLEGGFGLARTDLFGGGYAGGAVQSSVMSRGRLVHGGWGASVGVGASIGAFKVCDGCPFEAGDIWSWDHAVWFNYEAAIEHRWSSGLGLRVFAGVGRILNPGSARCEPHNVGFGCDLVPAISQGLLYVGVGFRIPLTTALR